MASLDTCDVSPVRPNSKHITTPRRTRSKTSRGCRGVDVHTICSTPNSQSPRAFNSPSSSFPQSQENCPDVIWDFSSPKLPKGAKRKELKLTVPELLENLNQLQGPDCSNQSAPYVKLLEKWMSKQTVNAAAKKTQKGKKGNKKRSQAVEELKKFLENISRPKNDTVSATCSRQNDVDMPPKGNNTSKLNASLKSLFDSDNTDDSTEELWGDIDNSFIVKATQELDSVTADNVTNQNNDIISTIPETAPSPKPNRPTNNSSGRVTFEIEKYSDILEQLSNVDWDSDVDTDEWDNGFLVEDDALSLIPDEVLTGSAQEEATKTSKSTTSKSPKRVEVCVDKRTKSVLKESVRNCRSSPSSRQATCSTELFNSFEDESFEDESLFLQPEVLSQIDEVENMLSQAPRCTPEEIEKKKDEAIQKRLRSRLVKKS